MLSKTRATGALANPSAQGARGSSRRRAGSGRGPAGAGRVRRSWS